MNRLVAGRCAIAAALLLAWASLALGQNLIEDPSFEQTKDRDRWGAVFVKWGGSAQETPARFEASTIAHSGKHSCEMFGDLRTKIRLASTNVKLQAGRYRVKCFVRGMDIGKGIWNVVADFSCGFDGKYFPIKQLEGTYGWRPITYVFDVTEQQAAKPFNLYVGLWGGGRMWVDDASLEKVDANEKLTAEPVVGEEEAQFAPPAPVGKDAVHCHECAYLNSPSADHCWACGATMAAKDAGSSLPAVKVIADFEDGKTAPFTGGKITTENAPQGKYGVQMGNGYLTCDKPQDWSGYDYLRFDTYNPSDKPAPLMLELRDVATRDYWTRVNYNTIVPPGKGAISFRTDFYVGEKSRPGRALMREKIVFMAIGTEKVPVVVDNFRLEKSQTTNVNFDGLLALDFGMIDSPVMEGFAPAYANTFYTPARGYGWGVKTEFWRAFNVLQPEALTQDFIVPLNGTFRVDLPDGQYNVVMNLDSPGGFWGETQTYRSRQVSANGKLVVDDKQDYDSYIRNYFRNSGREDLPGIDTFTEYVQRMFSVKQFTVDVSGGKLELAFKGDPWGNCLSYLVIYPANKADQGKKFLDWVNDRRKEQFNEYFKQVTPKAATRPANGYVLFTRSFMTPVNAYDGPSAGETIGADGLSLAVAQGEESPLTIAVQPSGDLGPIDQAISELKNEKGVLDASSLRPGWLDYRVTRVSMEGSIYTVAPRYWHATPAPAAPNVTRRFWIRVKTPANAAPGTYRGQITVKPAKGEAKSVPVAIRVLPFALDPITDVAVGPWVGGIGMGWNGDDAKTQAWNWSQFEKALDVLKEAGCTTFTGRPTLRVIAKDGKVTLDATQADKEMALIRAKGFTQMISSYGAGGVGYSMYGTGSGPDEAAAKAAGFPDMVSYLKAVWGAVDAHAVEKDWVPVAWNLCDEPLGDAAAGAAANALAHRKAAEGLKRTTFMGATSMTGNDPKNVHMALVKALPMPSLNLHDEASLQVLKEAGNRFSFYNGGNRWTYGRYMKALVVNHELAMRVSWHYNVVAGDPYYALDCREDDYCWFNTNAEGTLVPSTAFLTQIQPGLNDYRYLSTLQRLVKEKPANPAAAAGKKLLDEMLALKAGADRNLGKQDEDPMDGNVFDRDRAAVAKAIEALLK